jgi:hypothetical protein
VLHILCAESLQVPSSELHTGGDQTKSNNDKSETARHKPVPRPPVSFTVVSFKRDRPKSHTFTCRVVVLI